MASFSKDIPDEVWSRHKDRILKLRFDERLPLDAAKSKSRNIVQVMKDDHGFEATAAQYETQLKKWKAAKNLKRKDWETILPIYNDLEKRNLKPRVRLGDQILDERKVKKARRYLGSEKERADESDALFTSSEQTRLWRIEYCLDDGEYTDYSDRHLGTNNRETSPPTALSLGDNNTFPSAIQNRSLEESATWDLGQYRQNTTDITCLPSLSPPLLSFEDFEPMPNFLDPEMSLSTCPGSSNFDVNGLSLLSAAGVENSDLLLDELNAPFTTSSEHILASTPGAVGPQSLVLASDSWVPPSRRMYDIDKCVRFPAPSLYKPQLNLSKDQITSALGGISKDPTFRMTIDTQSVSVQHIINSLQSLLYDYRCGQGMSRGLGVVAHQDIPTSEIFKRVILSIANNFAGLTTIPRAIVLGMLKSLFSEAKLDPVVCLKSQTIKISKPLADNLFRAAVEAGDEELVGIILDTTSRQDNVVNINEIVCEVGHMRYSALSMAAYLHRPAMVRNLLQHGAKIGENHFTCGCRNKHYQRCPDYWTRDCPLTVIFDQYRQPEDQDTYMKQPHLACNESEAAEIVKLILHREPAMVARLLKHPSFFETTSDRLLEVLVAAVPSDRHGEIFKLLSERQELPTSKCRGLYSFVGRLGPQRAKHIVSTLLSVC